MEVLDKYGVKEKPLRAEECRVLMIKCYILTYLKIQFLSVNGQYHVTWNSVKYYSHCSPSWLLRWTNRHGFFQALCRFLVSELN